MIVTLVHIPLQTAMTQEQAKKAFTTSAPHYQQVAGLIRKYYTLSEDRLAVNGIYLWHNREAASICFDDQWHALIQERYKTTPTVTYMDCPVVVDNLSGEVLVP